MIELEKIIKSAIAMLENDEPLIAMDILNEALEEIENMELEALQEKEFEEWIQENE